MKTAKMSLKSCGFVTAKRPRVSKNTSIIKNRFDSFETNPNSHPK